MALAVKRKVRFNYHDYLLLPEGKRYEIIDGDLHMTPAPLIYHQYVLNNLLDILRSYVKKQKNGMVLCAPVDVVFSNEDIVQPDILFISNERSGILTKENVQGAPDLIVEILSPSTKQRDVEVKFKLYEQRAVREYWIVDPDALSIEVFTLKDEGLVLTRAYTKGLHVASPLFGELKFLVDEVF